MSEDPRDWHKRNALRKKQIEYAASQWVRTVGDRVQLSEDYGPSKAWESGTIWKLEPNIEGFGTPRVFVTVRMDSGDVIYEHIPGRSDRFAPHIPIVPHEDYFKEGGDE